MSLYLVSSTKKTDSFNSAKTFLNVKSLHLKPAALYLKTSFLIFIVENLTLLLEIFNLFSVSSEDLVASGSLKASENPNEVFFLPSLQHFLLSPFMLNS